MRVHYLLLHLVAALLLISGCGKKKEAASTITPSAPEEDSCSEKTYSSPVSITGKGTFGVWVASASGLTSTTTKNIRSAEVRVLDSAGSIIQCGETASDGTFSLDVPTPSSSKTYIVEINSRSYGSKVKASILENINDNNFYTLDTSVTITSSTTTASVGTLHASHTGDIMGGAFNILDQIYEANDYLRNQLSDPSFVANKVNVYWKAGFNPVAYYGGNDYLTLGLSFFDLEGYLTGAPSLFILGGLSGNTSSADTDHFDNSVILHEYFHFLEEAYAKSDSPGGQHNGNFIIDPRLAWSEGFANFFPSAVMGVRYYIDTSGNNAGSTGAFDIDLETPSSGYDLIDAGSPLGEGNFRELSVARSLWDLVDSTNGDSNIGYSDTSTLSFGYLWEALTDSTIGLAKTNMYFRSAGHFFSALSSILIADLGAGAAEVTAFNNVLSMEAMKKDTSDWGSILTGKSTSCAVRTMYPEPLLVYTNADNSSVYKEDLLNSNDFFQYYHAGGALRVELFYTQKAGTRKTDLDLIIYKDNFIYKYSDSILSSSQKEPAVDEGTAPNAQETAYLSNAPAGYYMINVMAYETSSTQKSTGADYYLKVGSKFLCP